MSSIAGISGKDTKNVAIEAVACFAGGFVIGAAKEIWRMIKEIEFD